VEDEDQMPTMLLDREIQFLNENEDNSDEDNDEVDTESDPSQQGFMELMASYEYDHTNGMDSDIFGSALLKKHWRLVGVDPQNDLVDETEEITVEKNCMFVEVSSGMVKVALHGDVSGTATILGVDGMPVMHPYPDLSHMVFGIVCIIMFADVLCVFRESV